MKDMTSIQDKLQNALKQALRFRILIFLVVLACIYGFIAWRVNTLSNVQPSQSEVASQAAPSQPRVDKATLDKIQQLQDNSVNVRSLFDQARQNPFQE